MSSAPFGFVDVDDVETSSSDEGSLYGTLSSSLCPKRAKEARLARRQKRRAQRRAHPYSRALWTLTTALVAAGGLAYADASEAGTSSSVRSSRSSSASFEFEDATLGMGGTSATSAGEFGGGMDGMVVNMAVAASSGGSTSKRRRSGVSSSASSKSNAKNSKEVIDRKVRNRLSAAASRKRRADKMKQLEDRVAFLEQENAQLKSQLAGGLVTKEWRDQGQRQRLQQQQQRTNIGGGLGQVKLVDGGSRSSLSSATTRPRSHGSLPLRENIVDSHAK